MRAQSYLVPTGEKSPDGHSCYTHINKGRDKFEYSQPDWIAKAKEIKDGNMLHPDNHERRL